MTEIALPVLAVDGNGVGLFESFLDVERESNPLISRAGTCSSSHALGMRLSVEVSTDRSPVHPDQERQRDHRPRQTLAQPQNDLRPVTLAGDQEDAFSFRLHRKKGRLMPIGHGRKHMVLVLFVVATTGCLIVPPDTFSVRIVNDLGRDVTVRQCIDPGPDSCNRVEEDQQLAAGKNYSLIAAVGEDNLRDIVGVPDEALLGCLSLYFNSYPSAEPQILLSQALPCQQQSP